MAQVAVVILGHRLQSSELHPELEGRVDLGVDRFQEHQDAVLILTGGQTDPGVPLAECEAMKARALDKGVPQYRILLDDEALDTIGNGYFTRRMVDQVDTTPSLVEVITSCYHLRRALFVFENCFGDTSEVRAPDCFQASNDELAAREDKKLETVRDFFEGIPEGDLDAIQERLVREHDLYDST